MQCYAYICIDVNIVTSKNYLSSHVPGAQLKTHCGPIYLTWEIWEPKCVYPFKFVLISTHKMNAQIWALRALLNVSVAHIWPSAHICQSVIRHKADEFDFNVIKRSFDCSAIGELSKIHKKLIINELIDAITDVARSFIKIYTCVPQVAFFQSANLSVIILFNK